MTVRGLSDVRAILEEVRRLQRSGAQNGRYDDVDLDDPQLFQKLFALARTGEKMTVEDVDRAIGQVNNEAVARIIKASEQVRKCEERRDDLKVYYVYNTADRRLIVLAKDAQCARQFAVWHGHIQEKTNGKVMVMKPEHEIALRVSGKALGRALRDGYPGVVTEMGDNVVMERSKKVYTPMTVVKPGGSS